FEIRDFIPLTGGLRLRFTASDYGADNTVEAAIDDVEVIACPDEDPAGVEENVNVDTPEQVELLGSRHNPFANSTHVFFELPRRMHVSIRVYDSAGRLTADILSRIKSAGVHSVPWDGRTASGTRAAPGMYFIRLEAGGAARTAKAVLVR
ncbi:MAG: FlgD immunoglobulin-like domain containing protein, partial [bacterium]